MADMLMAGFLIGLRFRGTGLDGEKSEMTLNENRGLLFS
jgi:hypothetical protein